MILLNQIFVKNIRFENNLTIYYYQMGYIYFKLKMIISLILIMLEILSVHNHILKGEQTIYY